MIDKGTADCYLSFEWLEGLRHLGYTHKNTLVFANDWRIDPVSVSSGAAVYPSVDSIRAAMREHCACLHEIPATSLAVSMGNSRVFNSVIIGGLARFAGGDPEVWRSVVTDRVPAKVREVNAQAFDKGFRYAFPA